MSPTCELAADARTDCEVAAQLHRADFERALERDPVETLATLVDVLQPQVRGRGARLRPGFDESSNFTKPGCRYSAHTRLLTCL